MKGIIILLLSLAVNAKQPPRTPDPKYDVVEENDIVLESRYMTVEGYEAPFDVILPADYKTSGRKYPVLYLFHGIVDDNHSWQDRGNLVALTRDAVRKGVIRPFIIVLPNAYKSFYVDGLDLNMAPVSLFVKLPVLRFESFFVKELQPFIERHYPVMKDREHTAVCGISMGGYGATYYAFKYPRKYSYCASISGAVGGGDWTGLTDKVPSVQDIFERNGYGKRKFHTLPQYVMDCGEYDVLCRVFNEITHSYLQSVDFHHTYRKFPGGHEWSYWQKAYERMLPELAKHFDK